ncbi:MAG: hypothetical protein ABSE93_20895 [Terriglobia bacterium]
MTGVSKGIPSQVTPPPRRTTEKPGGQPWTTCGSGCPELANGQCKPSGDLRFVLADFPRLGSVCRIHTCSYRSIRQIRSALQEIQTFTGGRLAGITAKLTVRPEEATYFDRKEKRKKTSSIWALSLEVEGDDMRKLIANLGKNRRPLRRGSALRLLNGDHGWPDTGDVKFHLHARASITLLSPLRNAIKMRL